MSFAHPWALLLLLLLVPLWLLYWLRLKVPREVVGTALFWQKALAEEPRRAAWQRWRVHASVAVQTLVVILLALAAAGPEIPAAEHIVLVIDNSATMRATDVQPSRLEQAKSEARRMIDSLRWCDEMAVVATSPEPKELQSSTGNKALLRAAVDRVEAQATPAAIDWAVKLARDVQGRLAPGPRAPRIVLLSDGTSQGAAREAQTSGVEVVRVGTAASNRAITGLSVRRQKDNPDQCEVFVEVRSRGARSAQAYVVLATDHSLSPALDEVSEDRWQEIRKVNMPNAGKVTAKIEPPDAYPFDDAAEVDVPAAPKSCRVTIIADERSHVREVLAHSPRVEQIQDGNAIKVIDGKTPENLPAGPLLIFTPAACDLWQFGDAIADPLVSRVDESSPVTAGAKLFDAYLPEARQLQLAGAIIGVAKPILWANTTPLGYAIDRPNGRIVIISGNLATSNLPLQADFSKLVSQALDWLDGQEPWKDEVYASKPGSSMTSVADLRVPTDIGVDSASVHYDVPGLPLWIPLAAAAAALVIVEWCLYQRRWTS